MLIVWGSFKNMKKCFLFHLRKPVLFSRYLAKVGFYLTYDQIAKRLDKKDKVNS